MLINKGAKISTPDRFAQTPLMLAIKKDNKQFIRCILTHFNNREIFDKVIKKEEELFVTNVLDQLPRYSGCWPKFINARDGQKGF